MKSKTALLVIIAALAGYGMGMRFPLRRQAPPENVRYIPHKAPEGSYFGKYEGEKGPFMINSPESNNALVVEDHNWKIDSGGTKYVTTATGYLHNKKADGTYEDIPMEMVETFDYDTVHSTQIPEKRLPIADADKLPDSMYYSSLKWQGIFSAPLWERIRTAALPYTFVANSREYTVTNRSFQPGEADKPYTTVASGMMHIIKSKEAPVPFHLKEDRFITQ